jgi:hypothetical protein
MLVGLSAPLAWSVLQRQGQALEDRFTAQPKLAREADGFRERAAAVTTPEQLLKDRRTLQYVLESYGLESEISKTAVLRKLMTQDPDEKGSLANRLTDARWRQFARDFSEWDVQNPFRKTGAVNTIIERRNQAAYEKQLGQDAPGLREALYFQRNAADAVSVLTLMSDSALALVVRVGLGLPSQFAGLEFEQQRAVLEKRVDLETFSDPKRMDQFLRKFLVRYEQEYGGAASSNPLAGLLGADGGTGGLFSLLGSTLNLRI